MKRDRSHEVVCDCGSYDFPHRMFGGKCEGLLLVEEGYGSIECENCVSHDSGYCEVLLEQEKTTQCPLVQEFIEYNEIKVWNKKLK